MTTPKRTTVVTTVFALAGAAVLAAAVAADPPPQEKKPEPAAKAEKPAPPERKEYVVTGRVFEADGKTPMKGATVTASVGYGTLFKGGEATTDRDGAFRLTFSGIGVKGGGGVAVVWAWKPGYFASNSGPWPTYLLTDKPLPKEQLDPAKYSNLVLGEEARLEFRMAPAAHLRVKLVDDTGTPMARVPVWMTGQNLRPGGSVIASGDTDADGVFVARDLPTSPYRLVIGDKANPRRELELGSIPFADPVEYTADVTVRSWTPEDTHFSLKVTRPAR